MSPEILPSALPSPHVIKQPLHGQIPKQRSSSVNSTGSNHTHHSVVSLDSPRNSIISLDDAALRPLTRNNSTASLNSTTNTGPKEHAVLSRGKLKLKGHFGASAIFSDDDSEIEKPTFIPSQTSMALAKIRRRQESAEIKPGPIKRDFQFQFTSPPLHSAARSPIPIADIKTEDTSPSPLSLLPAESSVSKKHKNTKTNLSQSLLLKKKIYSKDIQLELSPPPTTAILKEEGRYSEKPPPLKESFSDAPILSTLNQQNQLISEMNKKWNKSLLAPRRARFKLSSPSASSHPEPRESRKRSRSYSFGDEGDDEESFNEL